jgi:steroid delta-isomerase-like uncharacterized protein
LILYGAVGGIKGCRVLPAGVWGVPKYFFSFLFNEGQLMMSTAANKAIIHRVFEQGFNQGKLEIVDELFSTRFVDHSTPEQVAGAQGVKEYFAAVRAGFPDMRVNIEDIVAEGEKVVVRTTWQGTHLRTYDGIPASNRQVARTMIQIFHIVNGKIEEEWNEGESLLH